MPFTFITENRASSVPVKRQIVFVTEGMDDAIFLEEIFKGRGEDASLIEIRYSQGVGNIPAYISGLVKEHAFTRKEVKKFCAIIDADEDFRLAETRLVKAFSDAGLPAPAAGKILKANDIVVGSYILPKIGQSGMLEDLILEHVNTEKRSQVASAAIAEIHKDTALDKTGKRAIQIFLALSPGDLCRGPGQAIRNGSIPFDHKNYSEINEFLDSFFAS